MKRKQAFELPEIVADLLPKTVDRARLIQAVESALNDLTFIPGDSKSETERKARIGGKGETVTERQSTRTIDVFAGKSNTPSKFAAYCDEVRVCAARVAKFEGKVVLVQIPAEYTVWIAKFDSAAPKAEKPATNGSATPAAPRRKRNTTVKAEEASLAPVEAK